MTDPYPLPYLHLRGGGVSLLLRLTDGAAVPSGGLPVVLHWGADLGDLDADLLAGAGGALDPPIPNGTLTTPVRPTLLPGRAGGWRGRPGLAGARPDGTDWSPSFTVRAIRRTGGDVVLEASDDVARLDLRSELSLDGSGLLRLRHAVRNTGDAPYGLAQLLCLLPVPPVATEVLDLTGRWCRERHPQRRPLTLGTYLRETRHGRTGHDAPFAMVAGTPGFGWRGGEVWATHLGWSGDVVALAEREAHAPGVLGAGELLEPGEIVLAPGEEYETPWLYAAYSGDGLDGVSRAFHRWLRQRPDHPGRRHPGRARPVVLNTWEAVYFEHDLDRLTELAEVAAEVGVERFVLDDGWFLHRRDDSAGLGDWWVDPAVWPHGLTPLIDRVKALGMEFGLWVEPEMVNPDSDLFRAHPDWILSSGGRMPLPWRHQQVLDLVQPEVFDFLLERLDALLTENDVGYLKWDHNRDLVEPGHLGRAAVHAQTTALYRLLDELRARHPRVEIESCSSGGARVDLGILARTDRVWASDTNDALERQTIQRWTQLLLPPELVGSHVGPPTAHTTGRTHSLAFRAGTALFGHFGIEWDIRTATPGEQRELAAAVAFYRRHRELLHGGDVVRADHHDPAAALHGVVSGDRREAIFAYVQLAASATEAPGAARFPGLDRDQTYRVTPVRFGGNAGSAGGHSIHVLPPGWLADPATASAVPGALLERVGLPMPVLLPEELLLLHVTAARPRPG
jgi:alpha-galactosidase